MTWIEEMGIMGNMGFMGFMGNMGTRTIPQKTK